MCAPVKRLLLPMLFLAAASCSEETGADAAAADAATARAVAAADLYDDSDCNLSTPLVEGVPGSPGNLIPSDRNPNGDSELAVLMRRFVDDLREARLMIEAGQPLKPLFPTHRKMRCAWPTVPAERDEAYDGRAKTYLTAVRAFDEAPGKHTYNAVVTGCVACHTVSCGGVIPLIETLQWQ